MLTPGHPLDPLIRNFAMRWALSDGDRDAIRGLSFTLRTLDAASYLVREAEAPTTCAVLLSGFAFRQKLVGNGDRQIVSVHLPGDAMDLQNLFLDVSDHSVQMLTRGDVAIVPRAELQQLSLTHPAIGRAMIINILVEASISREWVLNIGRRNARSRAAHLLCEFATRLDAVGSAEEHGYELPMTQEQLGDALGLTPVHVNRTLKLLEKEGLIARTRRTVRIPDWRQLRDVADFNKRYLHLERQHAGG